MGEAGKSRDVKLNLDFLPDLTVRQNEGGRKSARKPLKESIWRGV